MAHTITRRESLRIAASAAAAAVLPRWASADVPRKDVAAPKLAIESGASLRILRPARFVEPDETIFRANVAKFQQTTGVEARVDFIGWEEIRQQTAVAANTGAGADVVLGWSEDPHIYADKLLDLSDVAEYLGQRYGGWSFLGEKYGKRHKTNNWIGIPFGGSTGPIVYRKSALKEAGFDKIPDDLGQYLKLCQALKRINKPAGFALGNAVGDGNGFANWLLWSHGAFLVDDAGKVAINSKETVAALTYLKDLYPTFVAGTLSWGDPSNNRAFAASECWLTSNGVSLYFALKNDAALKAIAEDTDHAPLPSGVVGKQPASALILNGMVFKHTKAPNAAKAFLIFMMESEQYDPWLTGCLGYWAHTLRAYAKSAVWSSDPKLLVYRDGTDNPFWTGYKGPISAAAGTVAAEYILVQTCASVASGQATPAEAAAEAERRTRRYYR